jgi:carbon storage regulator
MLVIRRKHGESVLIGDGIEVTVLEASSGQVTLGVLAPQDVPILRKEISLAAEANRVACRSVTRDSIRRALREIRQ